MGQAKSYIGHKFGLLTATERLPNYKGKHRTYYKCICDCGNETIVLGSNLVSNSHTTSCGCLSSRNGDKPDGFYNFLKEINKEDNRNYLVYKHTTPNGKSYIGMTCSSIKRRAQNGKGYLTQRVFYNAIKKYGWDNIKHEVLEEKLSHKEACEKEKYYISKYKTTDRRCGYNITSGGDSATKKVNPVIQLFNNNIVNKFESISVASECLKLSRTTIKKYSDLEENLNGYKIIVLNAIYDYELDDSFYTTRNKEHYIIKDIISCRVSEKMIRRNESYKKRVNQYDLEGKYIKTFNSIKEATDSIGQSISHILSDKYSGNSAGGYQWKYYDGDTKNINPIINRSIKSVIRLDKFGNELEKFEKLTDAMNIYGKHIWDVCVGRRKTCGGYGWKYVS